MKAPKTERRSPEQIAYDEANAAYQAAWRSDMPIREACNKLAAKLLAADRMFEGIGRLFEDYCMARDGLERREARTAELLAVRETAHKALTSSTS